MERAPRDFEYLRRKVEVGKMLRGISAELIAHVGYFIQMSRFGENQNVPPIWCDREDPRAQLRIVLTTRVDGKKRGDALEKFLQEGGSVLKIKAHIFPESQTWRIERWDSLLQPASHQEIHLSRVEPLYPLEGEGMIVQWLYLLSPVNVTGSKLIPYPTVEGLVMWFNRPGQKEVRRYWEPDDMIFKYPKVAEGIKNVLNKVHYNYWGVVL